MARLWFGVVAVFVVVGILGCQEGAATVESSPQEAVAAAPKEHVSVVAAGAKVMKLAGDYTFTEGPVWDGKESVYFTDVREARIHKWSLSGKPAVYRVRTGGCNGLYFDMADNMIACAGGNRMVVKIGKAGTWEVLADRYGGKRLNSPNDLWIDSKGGIYFTDPRYGSKDGMEQDGEHVYYITPDRRDIIRVIDDMVRPNGLIGTKDGRTLYVTDHGGKKTYSYKINRDGTLTGKKLFADEGSDGMTIDNEGNIYLTTDVVAVYDPSGKRVETIEVPEKPSNVTFGGLDNRTLFITARTSLYAVKTRVKGL